MKPALSPSSTAENQVTVKDPQSSDPVAEAGNFPVTVIQPQSRWFDLNLSELWNYRDLLYLLVWRDFSVRYRQTILGVAWAVISPLIQVAVFTIVFSKMAKLPSDGIPYPVFSYLGLVPWIYFSSCLARSSSSTVEGAPLLTKVYFPKLILPLSTIVNGLIDFLVQFGILLALLLFYGIKPGWQIVCLPPFVVLCAVTGLAVGFWASALSVKYRDIQHLIPFVSGMWMWLSPVAYSTSLVPNQWMPLYSINPMVGVIQGFRWSVAGGIAPRWNSVAISTSVVAVLFVGGLCFFRRTEDTFADII